MNQLYTDKMYDLFIKGGYIISESQNIVKKNIGIKDNLIKYIGNEEVASKKTVDATNFIISPGLINMHIHFGEYYIKGYKNKLSTAQYIEYAENFNIRNEIYKEEIRKSSTSLVLLESVLNGTTQLVGIRGFNAAEKYRLRLHMGYPLMKSEKLESYLNNAFENIDKLSNSELNNYFIFLHSLKWVDNNILEDLKTYFLKNMVKIAVHVCETEEEIEFIRKTYNLTPIEVLEKYKLLNERTLLIHANYLTKNDISLIKKYNATVVSCPNSNLKLNNKVCDVETLIKENINVCIGTDGSATNDSLNLTDTLRTLGLISKLDSNSLFNFVTKNPNKYLNNKTGIIKKNYKADLNIYDLDSIEIKSRETFINDLIYSSNILPKITIVNGNIIKINKRKIINERNRINALLKYDDN